MLGINRKRIHLLFITKTDSDAGSTIKRNKIFMGQSMGNIS